MAERPLHEYRLDNGLRVVVCEDHMVPLAAINIWYDVGSRHERPGLTGLAHLFEHLMFQGSAHVKEGEHAELLQSAGAPFNATTSFERTNYFETVPVSHFELALWLESDRMGSLPAALTQANLDNQRDVVKNERRQRYDNQPYGDAFERLHAMAFPEGHPFAHTPIGSMADLDAATLQDCKDFFATYYAPGNAVLSIVGDVTPEQAFEAVERYFGHLPGGPRTPEPAAAALGPLEAPEREELDDDVPTPAVFSMFRLPSDGTPEAEAAELAVEILGGGAGSRLYERLVRKDQTATEVYFGVQRYVSGPSSAFLQALGSDPAAIEAAVAEELARLAVEGPTPEETERAIAQAERSFLERTETVTGLANALSQYATLFGDPALLFGAPARAAAVSAEEIRKAAAQWLAAEPGGEQKSATLVYRPDEANGPEDGQA